MTEQKLPERVDVVVAGSGASGLVAAITAARAGLEVLIVESAEEFGGTTALSGGRVWIPGFRSRTDTIAAGIEYMGQIYDSAFPNFVATLAETGPAMAEFVEQHTPHRFVVCPNYPDYRQELSGATTGGRCFDMVPLSLSGLVPEAQKTRVPPGYTPLTHAEWEEWRVPARFDNDLLNDRRRSNIRTGGVALAAALIDGAVRAGARLVSSTALTDVARDSGGQIIAVDVSTTGGCATIRTRAVVLATGGYDQNLNLRAELLPDPLAVSASAPTNTGTTLQLALKLGALVRNTEEGWWMPMVQVPGDKIAGVDFPRSLIRERGAPRQILVNLAGERFVDEASPYNEIGKALHRRTSENVYPNAIAFLIFDEGFRQRYAFPGLSATGELPAHIHQAETVPDLAAKVGVSANGLSATVDRWNRFCEDGVDDDFGRGNNAYDLYYGDQAQAGNRNLGPISQGPFYAVRLLPGTIGSKGGPTTDTDARVLDGNGEPLRNLYAVGNAAAFWTGDGYPGPGATLTVGMAFGYRAGRAIERDLSCNGRISEPGESKVEQCH